MNAKLIKKRTVVWVTDNVATGATARAARLKRGISLRTVAARMALSAPFMSDLERGRRNWCPLRVRDFNISIRERKKV